MMCLYVISVVVFFHLFVRDLRVLWEDWLQWRVRHLQHILIAIELEEHPNHLDKPLYINSIVGVKTSSLHIFTLASAILSLSLSLSLSLYRSKEHHSCITLFVLSPPSRYYHYAYILLTLHLKRP
jgi:hypothetical protein